MHVQFSGLVFRRAILFVIALTISITHLQFALAARPPVPTITPSGGIFTSNVSVSLATTGKEIRYTLDGTEPGTNSPVYTAPLTFSNSVLLKARAITVDSTLSETVAEAYSFAETNLTGF